jgi:hypothetical protein
VESEQGYAVLIGFLTVEALIFQGLDIVIHIGNVPIFTL